MYNLEEQLQLVLIVTVLCKFADSLSLVSIFRIVFSFFCLYLFAHLVGLNNVWIVKSKVVK